MRTALNTAALDQLFGSARTHNVWQDTPVSDAQLQAIYEQTKWGPTAANSCPARFVFVKSAEAKAKLAPALDEGNRAKTLQAPVNVIVATDFEFYEQLPKRWPAEARARMAADARSDLAFGPELEAALPKGAMVFQLPILGFPEVTPPWRLVDYELFRAYLVTSDLKFSYGAPKLRSRSRWQRDLENQPIETVVQRLERYGFAALYINRKGYEDRAEKLLGELDLLGYRDRVQSAQGHQVVVLLRPDPTPQLPLGRSLTFGRGWHLRPEDGVRWAYEDASMAYFNPHPVPIAATIKLELVGVTPREVAVEHNGREAGRLAAGDRPVTLELTDLALAPGVNQFRLRSAEPAKRLSSGRNQLRDFGLKSSSIRVRPPEGGEDGLE